MPQVVLQLGQIQFADMEVPETINWGGDQSTVKQQLIGGQRVIDAMGRDDAPITWSGTFLGANAVDRAQYVNSMRVSGQQFDLSWGGLDFTVVVKTFRADYQIGGLHVPYSITCEVVSDNVTSTSPGVVPNVDDQMGVDMDDASSLSGGINDPTLSGLMGSLQVSVGSVSTFANASPSTIAGVLNPLGSAEGRVTVLFNAAQATATSVTSPGGVMPGAPVSVSVAALHAQLGSFQQQSACFELQSTLGRMSQNTESLGTNASTITQGGGNLFSIAANAYGDATKWDAIANANGLSDPQLTGINTITIPVNPGDGSSGGVLGVS